VFLLDDGRAVCRLTFLDYGVTFTNPVTVVIAALTNGHSGAARADANTDANFVRESRRGEDTSSTSPLRAIDAAIQRFAAAPSPRPEALASKTSRWLRQQRSYLIRCASMASQAFSASANVLKGDPPTLMAVLFKLMGRQEATKPGFPWSPGPLLLSLLITNEKPRSLALHISSSGIAGAIRLKCIGIPSSSEPKRPQVFDRGGQPVGRFTSGQGAWGHRPEVRI